MTARPLRALAVFAACALPTSAFANADHLLITEIGYDVSSSPEDSEFFEIYNPTDVDIELNDGVTKYFVSDDEDVYWQVVNGAVSNSSSDWALLFPPGTVIPARSFIVVVKDDVAWFAEFFPAGQAAFEDQPGNPQIFEFGTDIDTVPDMISAGSGTEMSLTNSGEDLVIYTWDSVSDLVVDVDHVCWADLTELINKTGVAIDGPDTDTNVSTYLPDLGGGVAAPDGPGGTSIQRIHAIEVSEVGTGGNGITGHDETTEDWSASFVISNPTPGRFLIETDGDLADLAAASAPLAVSGADGLGNGLVADYGEDGTITELYAVPEDITGDGLADILHVGVRGDYFATTATENGTYVGLDVDPGSGLGLVSLSTPGFSANDTAGILDNDITSSGVDLSAALVSSGIAFDAALGVTTDGCATNDVCGIRGFGTDGVAGTASDFAFLGDFAALSDIAVGSCFASLPGAPGSGYAGPEGLEFAIPLVDLGNPAVVALVAWTSGDGSSEASPNTLPENASNAFGVDQTFDDVACVSIDGSLPLAYTDSDGDLEGDPATAVAYCATAPAGSVLNGDDCDDGDIAVNTGATETCDGSDENCDGNIDEGFDLDADTYFDGADAGCQAAYPTMTDCNDGDAAVFPGAVELCDALDNDCDLGVDEDFDSDGDGAFTNSVNDCITAYGPTAVDCNDGDAAIFPGAAEVCDGDDENCNGQTDEGFDLDSDTYFDASDPGCLSFYGANADCDDAVTAVNPGAAESCANSIDDDCDGDVDALDADCSAGDDDDATGDDDDSAGDDDDATGDDDDSAGDDDDSAGDDDDATGDDDDSAGDDDDATGDDDDATGDDDDATGDDDDSVAAGDDDDATGCNCSTDGEKSPLHLAWTAFALLGVLVRRRRPGYPRS